LKELSERLKTELTELGAALVDFADLTSLPGEHRDGFDYGVSIAVVIDPAIINGIGNGITQEYCDNYIELNQLLDSLAMKAVDIIKAHGYKAWPKTKANVNIDYNNHSTILPHKTVATRAGLGWIGKCALLVTEKYDSAIRFTTVLTDAPLEVAEPLNQSKCGTCESCVRNCPGEALSGDLWSVDLPRDLFYDSFACRKKAIERSWKVEPGETHCGLCMLVCPRTRNYITSSGNKYNFPSVDIAVKGDFEEILNLQKVAYQSEAAIYNDYGIPPLVQTMAELQGETKRSIMLKVIEDRKIVGSVRAYEKDGTCYIGKLMVHPAYANRGIGKKLMDAIEKCFGGFRYELFTGHLSEKNLAFYQKLGYQKYKTEKVNEKLQLVYMQK